MNISLIYPQISKQERYGSKIGESGGTQQPLGIAYLGAYLRQEGLFRVQLIDAECEDLSHEEVLARCSDFRTGLYAISTTTVVFSKALALARFLKEKTPSVPVVLGGPHVSCDPEGALAHECFDAGVFGEGEATLSELARAYAEGRGPEGIKGVVYRTADGKIIRNPAREYIGDLDSLPMPARDLLPPLGRYLPPPLNYKRVPCATVLTTRGCPYACTFCDNNTFGRRYRMRSARNIVQELKHLVTECGVREIAFVDDTFNINDKRLEKLFGLMRQEGIDVPWTCMARINTATYEQLKAMKEAGCWHISFGIESGNPGIIKLIKKGIDLGHARQVIQWCRELGISTKGFFMIGHPGETAESIEETINYALRVPFTNIVVTLNTPLPGSWNFEHVQEYGRMSTVDWSKHNYWLPVFVPNGLSEEYMKRKHRQMIRRFYFRPSIILAHLMQLRNTAGLGRLFTMARSALAVLRGN